MDFVNQSQFIMNHIPVHVVNKYLPDVWPTALTKMCKDFSHGSTSNEQNKFRSLQNNLLNIILGLSELFSSTGTNAKARKQCWKVGGVKHGCIVLAPYGASNPVGASIIYEKPNQITTTKCSKLLGKCKFLDRSGNSYSPNYWIVSFLPSWLQKKKKKWCRWVGYYYWLAYILI